MKCPYVKGGSIKRCGAVEGTVVLSGCELKNFCMRAKHASCPVYQAKIKITGAKLPLDQYYAIYSIWSREDGSRVVA